MKKFFLIISILSFFIGCSSDKEEEVITTLELSQPEISFSASDETRELDIKSNGSWAINDIPDWISIDVKEGKGNYKITLKSEKNPKEVERSATMKIVAKDKIKELKVKQNAKNVELSISKSELIFDAEPTVEGLTFDIISNEPWTIADIPEWCTLSVDSGNGNMTITVIAEKNYIDTKRNAIIKIKAGSKTEELKIDQKALNISLFFSTMDMNGTYASSTLDMGFYSEASSKVIMVGSNTKWTVESNQTWCTIDKINGNEYEPITINVTENKIIAERNAEIIITTGSKYLKLVIRQGGLIEVTNNTPYQINQRDNAPHSGDNLIKKQVSYVDPGNGGENATWDFSKLMVVNNQYEVSYRAPTLYEGVYLLGSSTTIDPKQVSANSLIVCTEHNTMYFSEIKDNQLQAIGHENPTTVLEYSPRMIMDKYPTYYNDSYKYNYQSQVWYSGRLDFSTKGYKEMKADGYGTITLPSGTYHDALRIKYVQTTEYTALRGEFTVDPKELTEKYIIYKWYIKGYRYPVFETHQFVNTYTGLETATLAFYFPPQDHTYLKQTKQIIVLGKKTVSNVKNSFRKSPWQEGVLPILQLKK